MSEPIPESIPTSADRRSNRPTKKRAITPVSQQSQQVEALFAHPEREVTIPVGPKPKTLAPPPEIVTNVQGSSAGAGSGEFHVYKASRRREYERLKLMDDESKKEAADREFRERQEKLKKEDEERLNKNRAKREKAKARQAKKKLGEKGGVDGDGEGGKDGEVNGGAAVKKKLGPKALPGAGGAANDTAEVEDAVKEDGQAAEEQGAGITIHDED
jgi:hypothetical protein